MKYVKPLKEDHECQFEDCKAKATTRIYNKKLCRTHYLIVLSQHREKREKKK